MAMTVFLSCFILICISCSCETLHWNRSTELMKDNRAVLYVGDPVEFDCSLSQPWVNVSLWYKETRQYIRIIPDDHIKKINQKFRIDEIRLTDAGDYQCRAPDIKYPEEVYVQVHTDGIPRPKPTITGYPRGRSKVDYGSEITLQCDAIGDVILTLFKIDSHGLTTTLNSTKPKISDLPNGRSQTVTSFTITNFDGGDDGYYRCVLTRMYVTWRYHDEVYLSVKDKSKPTFTSFPSEMSGEEGSFFNFSYDTAGSPWPSIAWYKIHNVKKEELLVYCSATVCNKYIDISGLDVTRRDFSISRLLYPRDDMLLKCVIKNLEGSTNKTLRVSVKAMPKIAKGRDEIGTVYMFRDSLETNVVCLVKSANPRNLTYNWEIQQYSNCKISECKPEDGNWKLVDPSPKFRINSNSQNSTLTLVKNKQTVFIRCTAINYLGESNRTWKLIILAPIKVRALNENVVTDQGTNVRLSCIADVSIRAKVIWKRNNVIVSQNTRYSLSEKASIGGRIYTLHIKNVNITDGGTYQCTVVTSGESVSKQISLTVQEMKVPSVNLKSRVLYNTSSFIIPCNVTGHPRPTITWTKDGKTLSGLHPLSSTKACSSAKPDIYRMSKASQNGNSFLIVCNANFEEHSGWYTCKAINKLGNDSDKAFINITAAPKITVPKKGHIYDAELGKPFSLFCRSKGNPAPRVWWEKMEEGKGFQSLEKRRGKFLNFTSFEKGDIGSYQCVAENMFRREKSQIVLRWTSNHSSLQATVGPDNSKKYTVVIGCVSFAVLAIVIIVAVVLYKRKRAYGGFYILTLPPLPDYIKKLDPGTLLTEQTNKLPYDTQWEFPRNRLKFYNELGAGAFGKVFLAEASDIVEFNPRRSIKQLSIRRFRGLARRNVYVNNDKVTKVAIKTLKEDGGAMEYKDLLSELKIQIHVGEHKNIVNLLGACTKGRESDLWVIMEYCSNGNLLQFLRNRRDIYEPEWKSVSKDPNNQLTMTDLVIAAYQVARGMEFLASRMCIHRDLATRNILVDENYVIKIADFGLARDVGGTDSQYVKTSSGLLPIKWMAIEAIIDRLFTEKSDVWSFGIVLWELFTLGGTPYPKISPNEVSEFLAAGNRMDPPHLCPEEIVSLMVTCWHDDRDSRPTFKELVQMLGKIIEENISFEEGCSYLEVQGDEGTSHEYLRPSEVKLPQLDPFQSNSPLPPIPSSGDNESDSLFKRDKNKRHNKKFNFLKSAKNRGSDDNQLEKAGKDGKPENSTKDSNQESKGSDIDGYIDTSLTGKEKTRIERDLEKDRDSSEEPHVLDDYAYWKKTIV